MGEIRRSGDAFRRLFIDRGNLILLTISGSTTLSGSLFFRSRSRGRKEEDPKKLDEFLNFSYLTGMVTSSYDIAALILTPLLSYMAGSRKKPAFCAWGVFTMGVGFFIFMLPHFITPPYKPGRSMHTAKKISLRAFSMHCPKLDTE